ncbi:hypothetical protein MAPG_02418 [Magnaporthiopsis poae ATCC 64411]|uniref:Uncharacterized protein n=1 Tax=Magnaporthiopsis poae (strain ATCC 64411 / 73-15) TaxID=644358 RepID=A0A0C4DRB0_MAGP6|nr:hypothetical protein MAPG_02418 [Magnaporthiopsis poae ATCC 64411]
MPPANGIGCRGARLDGPPDRRAHQARRAERPCPFARSPSPASATSRPLRSPPTLPSITYVLYIHVPFCMYYSDPRVPSKCMHRRTLGCKVPSEMRKNKNIAGLSFFWMLVVSIDCAYSPRRRRALIFILFWHKFALDAYLGQLNRGGADAIVQLLPASASPFWTRQPGSRGSFPSFPVWPEAHPLRRLTFSAPDSCPGNAESRDQGR